jgi:transglutaminase-like putative cysteine protease
MNPERELRVTHDTTTIYDSRVAVACHVAHLVPRRTPRQEPREFDLRIEPPPSQQSSGNDIFGNVRHCFALYVPHESLLVRSSCRVRLLSAPAPDAAATKAWDEVAASLRYRAGAPFEPAAEFVYPSPFVPLLTESRTFADASFAPGRPVLECSIDLMRRIHADFVYEDGATEIGTPLLQVFLQKRGVCQDYTHVMIGCLRALGLPARYVSGYLLSQPPAGREHLLGADASHAWVSVWCPPLGWIDLDPTNDVRVDTSHVTLAIGRDYGDVMPLRGVIQGGGEHSLKVAVSVVPL